MVDGRWKKGERSQGIEECPIEGSWFVRLLEEAEPSGCRCGEDWNGARGVAARRAIDGLARETEIEMVSVLGEMEMLKDRWWIDG